MSHELIIGCIGKPSAGKSSFLNAATDATAKVGNYPFTTILPNYGVAFFPSECPCLKYDKISVCSPRYGKCVNGKRFVPVKVLDVAGLVPGASEGKGLGNQFLDDLRHAHVLLHVVDVSGNTNEKGEETTGYDPVLDVQWLREEIHSWVYNNLKKRWGNIVKKQASTKVQADTILQKKLSGYGVKINIVRQSLDNIDQKEPCNLGNWDMDELHKFVNSFLDVRFPTVLVLNKVDQPTSDTNISRICSKYPDQRMVPTSALAECFLRKMKSQNYIDYTEGDDNFKTNKEDPSLKPCDEKLANRLEKLRDLVLFRFFSTGIQAAITEAVELSNRLLVYPVKNLKSLSCDKSGGSVLRDCMLIPKGTQVREFAGMLHPDLDKYYLYAEGVNGQRLGETDEITPENNIIKYTTAALETKTNNNNSGSSSGGGSSSNNNNKDD